MTVSVGAAVPDFSLKDQSMKDVKLSDFQGKKNVVLVFYPLDWSPTCTNEHVRKRNEGIRKTRRASARAKRR
jgi:peroxiredoxin